MPPVIAAIEIYSVLAAEYLVAAGISATVASFIVRGAVAYVIGAAYNAAFGKKPQAPSFGDYARDRTVSVKQPVQARRVIYGQVRTGGTVVAMHTTLDDAQMHLVIAFAGHECEEIGDIYFNDENIGALDGAGNVTGGRYYKDGTPYVRIGKHLGSANQEADGNMMVMAPDIWTANHRLRGVCYIWVLLGGHPDMHPTGIPNISAVIKGKNDIYDPRTATTGWSDNAALCINNYLCDTQYGLGCTYASEIDATTLIASANVCDETVALLAGSEKRFTLNGSFESSQSPEEVLPSMLTALAGSAVYSGGKWLVRAGAYEVPTVTLSEGDLRGPIKVVPRRSKRELCNAVKGIYVSPDNNWQPADIPPVTNATYQAQDGGELLWRDIKLNWTTSAAMAQRLEKIELERTRQQITVDYPCKLSALSLVAGGTVAINNTRFGWSGKVFAVQDWRFVLYDDQQGESALGVDLLLRETASAVYAWASGEQTAVDPAPDTNLPNPFTVAAPGVPSVVESLIEIASIGVVARATVSCSASTDNFADRYQFEYRQSGATAWIVFPPGADTSVTIDAIKLGTYEFRVKAMNTLGVSSAYTATRTQEILGLGAHPASVTGLSIQAAGGLAILTFAQHADLDVRVGGEIVFRHCEAMTGATWEESVSIGEAVPGTATVVVLPLKSGTYLAKARDSSGLLSVSASGISTKQATVLAFTTVSTVQEDSVFSGTHSNTVAIDSLLKLAGTGLFDAIADFDSIASLDSYGGSASSGTYTFASGMDLGSVQRSRLTGTIQALSVNVNDWIDSRSGNLDDWENFDGSQAASADIYVEARETDDDPAGTPAWSDWKRLDAAEFHARAFQFRARLSAADAAYNIHISQLRVTAQQI